MQERYDIIVVGGGHAGAEAACAAARLGARVAMITMRRDAVARMSCNPAIGGVAKGQMVREIDALGGIMGLAIDRAGIQFRVLNRSKGPAVWSPRAQADREAYSLAVRDILEAAPNLDIVEGSVGELLVAPAPEPQSVGFAGQAGSAEPRASARAAGWLRAEAPRHPATTTVERIDSPTAEAVGHPRSARTTTVERIDSPTAEAVGHPKAVGHPHPTAVGHPTGGPSSLRVTGVTLTDGRTLHAPVVVLTTGTFMRGLMHCGQRQSAGGRIGEGSATHLSASLESLGLVLGRLKTGTPPRVHRETIDYADCEEQLGDDPPTPFSFLTDVLPQRQVSCWITWTNETAHDHIRANLHRAPMYSGQIRSTGPRYCPSIEDKVVRFADKPRHQIFLEPEGYDTERVYCNGISTSLPPDVQEEVLRAIPALRGARILQHGYAVEYDWIPTWQTDITLQSRRVRGLFLAGQINGTSGYEEAAAQGIISGVNAARSLDHRDPLILGRDEAYIGVLIDDLITRPPTEPYRMFTSRAEYRLQLRSDNADHRLTPVGRRLGLVDDARWRRFEDRQRAVRQVVSLAARASYRGSSLAAWMRRPDAAIEHLAEALLGVTSETMGTDALEQALLEAKYDGYITRQSLHIERFRRLESLRIPDGYDYARVPELRVEAREALAQVCPRTMGQASRVGGVSPADLTVLWVHLSRPR